MLNHRAIRFRCLFQMLMAWKCHAAVIIIATGISLLAATLHGQATSPLTLDQVRSLLQIGAPDPTVANEVASRGVAFQPSLALLNELESDGAGVQTLAALRKLIPLNAPSANPRESTSGGGQHALPLTVRHLHEGGWDSHVIKLELTADSVLLTGPQQYSVSGNVMGNCVFPSEIPLERIVKVEAKPEGLASELKLFSATSNSFKILKLHLEYRDIRGGIHRYDFIPGDAQQSGNVWSGGNQEAMRNFAVAVKDAANLRAQQLKTAAGPTIQ